MIFVEECVARASRSNYVAEVDGGDSKDSAQRDRLLLGAVGRQHRPRSCHAITSQRLCCAAGARGACSRQDSSRLPATSHLLLPATICLSFILLYCTPAYASRPSLRKMVDILVLGATGQQIPLPIRKYHGELTSGDNAVSGPFFFLVLQATPAVSSFALSTVTLSAASSLSQ